MFTKQCNQDYALQKISRMLFRTRDATRPMNGWNALRARSGVAYYLEQEPPLCLTIGSVVTEIRGG